MTATIDVQPDHLAIVRGILRRLLPRQARVFAFGSRVRGGARHYSDLDLAIEWDRPLGLDLGAEIAEAFSESDLPYKVDVVELSALEPGFRARITPHLVPLPLTEQLP
ncbi:MAG: nucleotidyltransferase family protein [Acetobacteraceae bacterium]